MRSAAPASGPAPELHSLFTFSSTRPRHDATFGTTALATPSTHAPAPAKNHPATPRSFAPMVLRQNSPTAGPTPPGAMASPHAHAAHTSRPKIKKRKYSRKGCHECKRRKIKCDEAFPACFNCSRLNKPCSYLDATPSYDDANGSYSGHARNTENGANGSSSAPLTMKFYEPKAAAAAKTEQTPFFPENSDSSGPNGLHTRRELAPEPLEALVGDALEPEPETTLDEVLSFLPGEMETFHTNVNVFLDDFYLTNAADGDYDVPSSMALLEAKEADTSPESIIPSTTAGGTSYGGSIIPTTTSEVTASGGSSPSGVGPSVSSEGHPVFSIDDFALHGDPDGAALATDERLSLSTEQLTDQCVREHMLREPHTYYLRLLTCSDLSYHLFPYAPSVAGNGVVRLLLTYSARCTYLLTALLAIAATFQFIRTSEKRHDAASQFYIDVCFRALSRAFRRHRYFEHSAVFASSIEKLLLTVLIVSTRFTATTTLSDAQAPSSWKDHLRGARDLLVQYSHMTRASRGGPYMSSGLALAKCWFFAIEASAAMHTAVGGALSRAGAWDGGYDSHAAPDVYSCAPNVDLDREYQVFVDTGCIESHVHPEYHRALSRVGLVCGVRGGGVFNLYWGFNSSFIRPVLAFVSFTDAVKSRSLPHVPFKWTMHLLGLLDASLQERVVPEVCLHTFEIPRSSAGHPEYDGPDKVELPASCYVARGAAYYSWFDASHQFHGDYLSLRVMVSQNFLGLPRNHPDVQYLVAKFFGGAFFIKPKASADYEHERRHVLTDSTHYYLSRRSFDIRCIMVQSMFRLVSGIVVDDDQFERIELYFMGVLKLGNGSSLKSLDMVTRIRSLRAENKEKLQGKTDERIYDFYDSMNDIPFS